MTSLFFQKFWEVVGNQVTSEVSNFFETGYLPSEWNYTHLCLIPKKVNSSLMSDLRPISLCSVLYKIIAKILAQRLKHLLPLIVSPTQSAFVTERLISDNITMAHEVVHSLSTHPTLSSQYMAIKSDMSKAFDRVEWKFLKALLQALGFHQKWIQWIMVCVTTVTYSVLINDRPHGYIVPQRGLLQGDPISPSLFVLCTEALIHLLNKSSAQHHISGIQFAVTGPSLHHMLFADDSLFICKADSAQTDELKRILRAYEVASGQMVNPSKSSILFGSKVNDRVKENIKQSLGIEKEGGMGNYLGLPECFKGSKVDMLRYIHDSLKTRFSGWFARLLSQGGKDILIKTVALAMPIHAMSCFRLPKTTCDSLASAIANFWWSSSEDKRKIHWVIWEHICLSKEDGGLGFRDIEVFNQALLAKRAWLVLQNPNSLYSRVMKSKYFEKEDFLSTTLTSKPSFAWRSLLHGRDVLVKGLDKMVGNGSSLYVWTDSWIKDGHLRRPLIKNSIIDIDPRVSDLIDRSKRDWIKEKLEALFYPEDVALILKTRPVISKEDFWVWRYNKSGQYSVKSGYWMQNQITNAHLHSEAKALPSINTLKAQVWSLKTSPKIKTFMWKALSEALPVADKILSRGMKVDSRCQACGIEGETVNHLLFTCDVARQIWALSHFPKPRTAFSSGSLFPNFQFLLKASKSSSLPPDIVRRFPWTLWHIWKRRNSMIFEGKCFCPLETVKKINDDADLWFLAQRAETDIDFCHHSTNGLSHHSWTLPPPSWVKCNLAYSWDKKAKIVGVSWLLRNHERKVLLHSRHAFAQIDSLDNAKLQCLLWAINSMSSLKFSNVIFGSEAKDLVGAVTRPKAWPSYAFQASEINLALSTIPAWKLQSETPNTNQGALLIAKSASFGQRLHSYVGRGYPFWLKKTLVNDLVPIGLVGFNN